VSLTGGPRQPTRVPIGVWGAKTRSGLWNAAVFRSPAVDRCLLCTLIDRPHRLVMTWTFDDDPSNEQLIELSFSESEGSTTVVMVNSGISTDERRDAQDAGWHGCFEELERELAG